MQAACVAAPRVRVPLALTLRKLTMPSSGSLSSGPITALLSLPVRVAGLTVAGAAGAGRRASGGRTSARQHSDNLSNMSMSSDQQCDTNQVSFCDASVTGLPTQPLDETGWLGPVLSNKEGSAISDSVAALDDPGMASSETTAQTPTRDMADSDPRLGNKKASLLDMQAEQASGAQAKDLSGDQMTTAHW